jgi:holo-[acyl-carrier protein] synthase
VIVGIGVDIVDIGRVSGLVDRYKDRFIHRVFTDVEIRYAQKSAKMAERLAGRFAVKEAVLKAFGTGKSQGILWKDVETVRGPMGRPEVNLYGQAVNYMKMLKGSGILVTITHDGGKAIAFVIIERAGGKE